MIRSVLRALRIVEPEGGWTSPPRHLGGDWSSEPIGPPPVDHDLTGSCWCQPRVEADLANGGYIYIHREVIA